jgi:mannose-6-phosphate isomerase-like protein (cupin superfamily)
MTDDNDASARPVVAQSGVPIAAVGRSLVIYEWTGSGPSYMHVHHADDEAWHVLEGMLRFEFLDGHVDAPAGATVFVPAGVAHTYHEILPSRYLIILTPRLAQLIAELHALDDTSRLVETLARYETTIVTPSAT